MAANAEGEVEVKGDIEKRNKLLAQTSNFHELFKHIDKSKFKDDIEIDVTINMIMWTIEDFASFITQK